MRTYCRPIGNNQIQNKAKCQVISSQEYPENLLPGNR